MRIDSNISNESVIQAGCNFQLSKGGASLRIAICDDESFMRSRLREAIYSSGTLPPEACIEEFSDGVALINGHALCPFDVIYLDIQMDGKSGLEIGQEIRAEDRHVIIIFVTSHQEYVFQSFPIEPFDYIVKPVDYVKVNDILKRAIRKHNEQHYKIHFKWKETPYVLDISEVVYLESTRRHIKFVTADKEYECVGKLDDYESKLSSYGFLRCHQSFLINMNYIKSIETASIITSLGHIVNMTVRRRSNCLKALNLFIIKHRVIYGKNTD